MARYTPHSRRELEGMRRDIESRISELNELIEKERRRARQLEEELREARRQERKLVEERRRLKRELRRLRQRFYSYRAQARKWALENPGRVMDEVLKR